MERSRYERLKDMPSHIAESDMTTGYSGTPLIRKSGRVGTVSLTLCLVVGACGGERPEEERALPPGAPLAVSEAPVLVVGEAANDPNHEFHRVVTPFLLPDGGLGVPLAGENTIRIFDAEGEWVRSMGSSGEGPGEFMGLGAAWARGDTIEAMDSGLNRVTRFLADEAPETILLQGVPSAQVGVPGLESGEWILYGVKEVQRSGRDVVAVHHFAPDGSHMAELGEVYGFRRHVHEGGSGPDPISPRPLVRTEGDRVYMAETLTSRITEFDLSTGETHALEWQPASVLAFDEAVSLARDQVSRSGGSQMDEAWTLASFDALTGSEDVSVFWDFLVDGEEFFWIREYDPRLHAPSAGGLTTTGSGGEWAIIDRKGRHVTTVTVPDDLEPRAIDSDRLIGVRRNEFDVESVRVYRIERSGEPDSQLTGRLD